MKKIVTLLLALVMLVSVMVLPALAATAEIQPRYPAWPCIYCGSVNTTFEGYEQGSTKDALYFCNDCYRWFTH